MCQWIDLSLSPLSLLLVQPLQPGMESNGINESMGSFDLLLAHYLPLAVNKEKKREKGRVRVVCEWTRWCWVGSMMEEGILYSV